MIGRLGPALALCLAAGACVWPVPLPGEPIPAIHSSSTWSAADGTVTVEITVTDLVPTTVRLRPAGLGSPWELRDTEAPFSFEIDTSSLAAGRNDMVALADDGATIVVEVESVDVPGCNGHHELCDRSFAATSFVTTHNAMSNAHDGWLGPNQNLDVPGQLEAGVRALMLDTYRAGDLNDFGLPQVPDVDPDASYLCHALCALGSQPLAEGLAEIRAFLDANQGEVVTLILESYLDHDLTASAFDEAGLTPYAYTHADGDWPTLGTLVDTGRRLVVLQDEPVDQTHPWLMNVWDHAFETPFSNAVPGDFTCTHLRGSPDNALFILNHFLTDVFGSPTLAEQVNHNPLLIDRARECEAFHDTRATFVTVDFVDIGDTVAAVDALNGL